MSGFEWLIPVVTAAISTGGSLLGGANQNSANSAQAQRQMDFQWGSTEFQAAFAREMQHRQELNNMEYWYKGIDRDQNFALQNMNFQSGMVQQAMNENRYMVGNQQNFQQRMMELQQQFNRENTSAAQAFNALESKTAFERNAWLSGTAYQRAMSDMRAAGLNPLLAYQQGGATSPSSPMASSPALSAGLPSGASLSAPSGGNASVGTQGSPSFGIPSVGQQQGSKAHMENIMGPAFATASQVFQTMSQAQEIASRINVQEKQALLLNSQTANTNANTAKQVAETRTEENRPAQVLANTALQQAQQVTERAMPGLRGAQTAESHSSAARAAADAARQHQEIGQTNLYGRPSEIGNLVNLGERLLGRIFGSATNQATPPTSENNRNTGWLEQGLRALGQRFR